VFLSLGHEHKSASEPENKLMSTTIEQPPAKVEVTEEQSRAVAEEARETEWVNPSFMKEMFLGNFRFDLIDPYPERTEWRPEFEEYFENLRTFLRDTWDPIEVDHTGEDNLQHVA